MMDKPQNHRMAWVWDLKDHLDPPPHHRQNCQPLYKALDEAAQGSIQSGLDHHQEWGMTASLGTLYQCLTTPSLKKISSEHLTYISCLSV